jgi:hypothetical protein
MLVPAPGHYGDRARVLSTHATLEAARRAKGARSHVCIREADASARKGDVWLRVYEQHNRRIDNAAGG